MRIYCTICLSFFFTLKIVKKHHQTSTLNSQCSCSAVANEHPSQNILTLRSTYMLDRILTPYCQKEPQHPTQTEKQPH